MSVNLENAENALKSVYLDVVSDQLNNSINPFFAQIKHSSENVWGKEVRKLAIHGINGGIGAGTEDGNLPTASGNEYAQFVTTLKNLYGVIEISDKAIRASENNAGAFVNLLNSEMEGLIRASKFNFGRMLYGNGSGIIAAMTGIQGNFVTVASTDYIMEGMIVDICSGSSPITAGCGRRVLFVDRANKKIKLSGAPLSEDIVPPTGNLVIQGSADNEITGLDSIFNKDNVMLYGIDRVKNPWINPYAHTVKGAITELDIQKSLDNIEQISGTTSNFIICSLGVRRTLQELFSANKRVIDTTELKGGFMAMSYNGIPIVADRFCPQGTMYLLNTNDFELHQLCDWQWLSDDDGKVLKQIPGKPVYTATLVKYADLMCSRPNAQGIITGITEK